MKPIQEAATDLSKMRQTPLRTQGSITATTVAASTQALRQNKTGTTRSRPPSMTSSAAGHAKTVDQMADMDQELDFEELEEVQSIYSWPPDDESD